MMERFCKHSQRLLAINYFRKKAPSSIFGKVLNTPLMQLPQPLHSRCHYVDKTRDRLPVFSQDSVKAVPTDITFKVNPLSANPTKWSNTLKSRRIV